MWTGVHTTYIDAHIGKIHSPLVRCAHAAFTFIHKLNVCVPRIGPQRQTRQCVVSNARDLTHDPCNTYLPVAAEVRTDRSRTRATKAIFVCLLERGSMQPTVLSKEVGYCVMTELRTASSKKNSLEEMPCWRCRRRHIHVEGSRGGNLLKTL